MAEEFVDLYEVLELPVDADRNTLRKRINELYIEAQRNLDHRTFATRVKFQELFEVTLPQARYILLDDGRRDEYNRLVHAFRNAQHGTPIPPSAPAPATSSFKLEENPNASLPGEGPKIEALPASVDPEQLAKEREELWKKWKSGLEEALSVDGDEKPKARSATTASPTSFSVQTEAPAATPAGQPASIQAKVQPAPAQPAAPAAPAKAAPRPKVDISFDFEKKEAAPAAAAATSGWIDTGTSDVELTLAEIEQRRTEHRRRIMKDLLVNVGIIWGTIGALIVFVPGFLALVATMGHYYPRIGKPLLQWNPQILWGVGAVVLLGLSYFVSSSLSKSMRRRKAQELSFLSYEDLMKKIGKSS